MAVISKKRIVWMRVAYCDHNQSPYKSYLNYDKDRKIDADLVDHKNAPDANQTSDVLSILSGLVDWIT